MSYRSQVSRRSQTIGSNAPPLTTTRHPAPSKLATIHSVRTGCVSQTLQVGSTVANVEAITRYRSVSVGATLAVCSGTEANHRPGQGFCQKAEGQQQAHMYPPFGGGRHLWCRALLHSCVPEMRLWQQLRQGRPHCVGSSEALADGCGGYNGCERLI